MTDTGEWEVGFVSRKFPDNPGELVKMLINVCS